MQKQIGIWMDHSVARIVAIKDKEIKFSKIESNAGSNYRLSGGSRSKVPYGPQDIAAEGKMDDKRRQQLHRYYREIIKGIKHADDIYICGPAEAKSELEKEIKKEKNFMAHLVAVEAADKMTDNQLIAKIKKIFRKKAV